MSQAVLRRRALRERRAVAGRSWGRGGPSAGHAPFKLASLLLHPPRCHLLGKWRRCSLMEPGAITTGGRAHVHCDGWEPPNCPQDPGPAPVSPHLRQPRATLQALSSVGFSDAGRNWGEQERKRVFRCPWTFPHMCPGMLLGESCQEQQSLPPPHTNLFSPASLPQLCLLPSLPSLCDTPQGCCTLSTWCSHSAESRDLSVLPQKQEKEKSFAVIEAHNKRRARWSPLRADLSKVPG